MILGEQLREEKKGCILVPSWSLAKNSSVALADTFNTVLNTLGDLAQLGFAPDIHGNALCFLIRCMAAF